MPSCVSSMRCSANHPSPNALVGLLPCACTRQWLQVPVEAHASALGVRWCPATQEKEPQPPVACHAASQRHAVSCEHCGHAALGQVEATYRVEGINISAGSLVCPVTQQQCAACVVFWILVFFICVYVTVCVRMCACVCLAPVVPVAPVGPKPCPFRALHSAACFRHKPGLSAKVARHFLPENSAGDPKRPTFGHIKESVAAATSRLGFVTKDVASRVRSSLAPDAIGRDLLNSETGVYRYLPVGSQVSIHVRVPFPCMMALSDVVVLCVVVPLACLLACVQALGLHRLLHSER